MIDYISGPISEINPTLAIIDCQGLGYEINITVIDYDKMHSMQSAKLFIHESIREDAHVLFGFLTKEERALFRLLIGVSGVGPNTARLILSAMTVEQLEGSIASGNDSALKAVKGIGGKTAQRIIVDLKDKINALPTSTYALSGTDSSNRQAYEDALAALVALGFTSSLCQKALNKLFSSEPGLSTEKAIKMALQMM